jgi:hypothetical protein
MPNEGKKERKKKEVTVFIVFDTLISHDLFLAAFHFFATARNFSSVCPTFHFALSRGALSLAALKHTA